MFLRLLFKFRINKKHKSCNLHRFALQLRDDGVAFELSENKSKKRKKKPQLKILF